MEERRNRADLLEMFKMLTGKSSPKFESLFERSTLSATRGHSVKLVKHCCKLDLRKYFFCERVIDRWNQLSEDCVSCVTVNSFKGKLDMVRQKKMGFFEDHTWSDWPSWPHQLDVHWISAPGVATPSKWPGKWSSETNTRFTIKICTKSELLIT